VLLFTAVMVLEVHHTNCVVPEQQWVSWLCFGMHKHVTSFNKTGSCVNNAGEEADKYQPSASLSRKVMVLCVKCDRQLLRLCSALVNWYPCQDRLSCV